MVSPIVLDDTPFWMVLPIGALVFGVSVAMHALIGVVFAAVFMKSDIIFAAVTGAVIGLMFSSFVLFELIIGKFFVSNNKKTQVYLMLGQSCVWIAVIGLLIASNFS